MTELRSHTLARVAYERVTARQAAAFKQEYGALAHKFPGMILQNGLAQATGFLLAKGKAEHLALMADLAALLRHSGAVTSTDPQALHQAVIAADLAATLLLTRRALEASGWMKRYVQGALGIDATGEASDGGGSQP
jgi:CRISPR-associated protein Cmr5